MIPGRPKILNDREIEILINEIQRLISNGEYPTVNDMVQFDIENIKKSISSETIRNYIIKSGFNIVIGNHMEEDLANENDLDIFTFVNVKKARCVIFSGLTANNLNAFIW